MRRFVVLLVTLSSAIPGSLIDTVNAATARDPS